MVKKLVVLFAIWILLPSFAVAQTPDPPLKVGPIEVHGSIRSRVEGWRWFQGEGNSDYVYSGSLIRLKFNHDSAKLDWVVELGAPVLLGLPDDAIAAGPQGQLGQGASYFAANHQNRNAGMVFPFQAYLKFKKLFGGDADSLLVGRFEFADGSEVMPKNPVLATLKRERITHRLLGPFAFTHVQRGFYGLQYNHHTPKYHFTALAAAPSRGVFQVDAWGVMKTAITYGAVTRQLEKGRNSGEWRVFGIYYDDWRAITKTDDRAAALRATDRDSIQIGTIGSHYLHSAKTSAGNLDAIIMGAVQVGKWGRLSQRAGAFMAEGGFQPAVLPKLRPWIRGGMWYSTGDGNPNDNRHGTFFQIMPTARQYARFPFFNLMNSEDFFGSIVLRPAKALTWKSEFHALRLTSAQDLWYLGGGAFQPWTFGFQGRPSGGSRSLANLYDTSVDIALNKYLSTTFYWGYAQGHTVIQSLYPKGRRGSLGFVELNVKF